MKKSLLLTVLVISLLAIGLVFAGCGGGAEQPADTGEQTGEATDAGDGAPAPKEGPTIIIGSKTFTENILLGQMTYDYLKYLGYPVEEQLNFGEYAILRAALVDSAELGCYWEYTNTLVANDMQSDPIYDPNACYEAAKAWDLEQHNIVWLKKGELNDTYAMVIRKDTQEKYNITKMSELAQLIKDGEKIRICAGEDYLTRPDSYMRVQEVYGYEHPKDLQIPIMSVAIEALNNGECELNMATTTDSKIAAYDLFVLEDDKACFPPYHAVPTFRKDIIDAYPDLETDMNKLIDAVNSDNIMVLIGQVDLDGMSQEEVSQNFLKENGLIQ